MLRLVFARTAVCAASTPVSANRVAFYSSEFDRREKAAEESYARRKEQEALKKLAETLKANKVDDHVVAEIHSHINEAKDAGSAARSNVDALSLEDMLTFRKEIVKEIRELEDVVGDLKYRVAQLEKRSR